MATAEERIPPLVEGQRLTREEFLRRWEAMPELKRAELIGGVVHMPSPLSAAHGEPDGRIVVAGKGGLGMGWARLTPSGALDPTFGDSGTGSADLGMAHALALQPGCAAVAVGVQFTSMTSISATIARFAL